MKLNTAQWLWMSAAALLMASVFLDIANVVNVPPIYWLLGSTSLLITDWWVMPSMKELARAERRRKRNFR